MVGKKGYIANLAKNLFSDHFILVTIRNLNIKMNKTIIQKTKKAAKKQESLSVL